MYKEKSDSYKNGRCSELSTGIPGFDKQIMRIAQKCVIPWLNAYILLNAYEAKRKK